MAKSSTSFKKGMLPRGKPFKKGQVPWNKGKPTPDKVKGKISASRKGKGTGVHLGARRRVIKSCLRCGNEFETGGKAGDRNQVYCSIHCARLTKGGRTMHSAGYVCIRQDDGSRKLEQRIIAEQMLGRKLIRSEVVHHIDGDKTNNRPENLIVMSQACHRALTDHLARLWVIEHLADNGRVAEEARDFKFTYQLTVSSGG